VTLSIEEAIARALLLHKGSPAADDAIAASEVIPVLALALAGEDEHDQELLALAESWRADPVSLGRRARDLAVELARRVAQVRGIDLNGNL
jgi:hypothetical protein